MNRRAFLGAAAARAALPATGEAEAAADVDDTDDAGALRECDLCGADHPADMVDWTTVPEIAPLQADACWTCQFVHEHSRREGHCAECGDPLDGPGFSIELEYPLGAGDQKLPVRKHTRLCGECGSWLASDINHRGVTNDPVAGDRFTQLVAVETERVNDLEAGDE